MGDLNYRVDANRNAADLMLREGMMEVRPHPCSDEMFAPAF